MNTRDAIKDEFEHMVNWKRVFEHIWTQIRWLNSYCHINELALRKIMKKFAKNFFAIKDNTVNKKLIDIINFCKRYWKVLMKTFGMILWIR